MSDLEVPMVKHRNRCGRTRRRGAAFVELALLLGPILAFIAVAATDFARIFNAYVTVTSCARNGALYGCLDSTYAADTSGIQSAALNDKASLSPAPTVSSSTSAISGTPYVTVTVTWTFSTLINYPGIPSSLTLSRTVTMRVVQDTPS
jgi:Flp pilus assembly protein TadG